MLLYELIIWDEELSYNSYKETFKIGVFSSENRAREVADYYLKNVEGFNVYKCYHKIIEKVLIGHVPTGKIYMVSGWNENEKYDAIDIIESDYYSEQTEALRKLDEMKSQYVRTEWTVDFFVIDKCLWKDGFVRV